MLFYAVIVVLLCIACWRDVQSRRIPNTLVVVGLALGLFIQAAAPSGSGLFHPTQAGSLGLTAALLGAVVGLALLMPFYVFRAMGAGDVKLMAMMGAWLGATSVAWAALFTLLAGGVLSIIVMLATRSSRQVFSNLHAMLAPAIVNPSPSALTASGDRTNNSRETTGRMPYAIAIAAGAAAEITRHWL
jgi:prepilin peptidase CpaA